MTNKKVVEQKLKQLERTFDKDLQKQAQDNISKFYKKVGCTAIAKEIKEGRNVTKNAEFGIRSCVHGKIAPTVNPKTLKFYPQTKKQMELEKNIIKNVNKLLENGGYHKMSSSLLSDIRKRDKEFEKDIRKKRQEG